MNDEPFWWEIGNERAHFEDAFPRCPAVWLPPSARRRPGTAAGTRPTCRDHAKAISPLRRGVKVVPPKDAVACARVESRPHRRNGAGKSSLFSCWPPPARRRWRRGNPPRWRLGEVAKEIPRPKRRHDFVMQGDVPLQAAQAEGPRAEDTDRVMATRGPCQPALTKTAHRRARRARPCVGRASRANSSTRRSRSLAAGACAVQLAARADVPADCCCDEPTNPGPGRVVWLEAG